MSFDLREATPYGKESQQRLPNTSKARSSPTRLASRQYEAFDLKKNEPLNPQLTPTWWVFDRDFVTDNLNDVRKELQISELKGSKLLEEAGFNAEKRGAVEHVLKWRNAIEDDPYSNWILSGLKKFTIRQGKETIMIRVLLEQASTDGIPKPQLALSKNASRDPRDFATMHVKDPQDILQGRPPSYATGKNDWRQGEDYGDNGGRLPKTVSENGPGGYPGEKRYGPKVGSAGPGDFRDSSPADRDFPGYRPNITKVTSHEDARGGAPPFRQVPQEPRGSFGTQGAGNFDRPSFQPAAHMPAAPRPAAPRPAAPRPAAPMPQAPMPPMHDGFEQYEQAARAQAGLRGDHVGNGNQWDSQHGHRPNPQAQHFGETSMPGPGMAGGRPVGNAGFDPMGGIGTKPAQQSFGPSGNHSDNRPIGSTPTTGNAHFRQQSGGQTGFGARDDLAWKQDPRGERAAHGHDRPNFANVRIPDANAGHRGSHHPAMQHTRNTSGASGKTQFAEKVHRSRQSFSSSPSSFAMTSESDDIYESPNTDPDSTDYSRPDLFRKGSRTPPRRDSKVHVVNEKKHRRRSNHSDSSMLLLSKEKPRDFLREVIRDHVRIRKEKADLEKDNEILREAYVEAYVEPHQLQLDQAQRAILGRRASMSGHRPMHPDSFAQRRTSVYAHSPSSDNLTSSFGRLDIDGPSDRRHQSRRQSGAQERFAVTKQQDQRWEEDDRLRRQDEDKREEERLRGGSGAARTTGRPRRQPAWSPSNSRPPVAFDPHRMRYDWSS